MAFGSGTPPGRPSVGQPTGWPPLAEPTAGSIATSPESACSSGAPPGPVFVTVSDIA